MISHEELPTAKKKKNLTIRIKELESVMNSIGGPNSVHLLVFLDEGYKGRPLDLNGLTGAVIQRDDKVEKVGLPEIWRGLLLKVSSAQSRSDPAKKKIVNSQEIGQEIMTKC